MSIIDYKAAGVDIEAGNEAVRSIKKAVESTFSPRVLTGIGSFGAMYDLKNLLHDYEHPVLVQSIDGVGTKMMVAKMMQKFDTIGIDLVSATTNDIIVLGAKPLTLLDYIANDKLNPEIIEQIIKGMVKACKETKSPWLVVKRLKCQVPIYRASLIWSASLPVSLKKIKRLKEKRFVKAIL